MKIGTITSAGRLRRQQPWPIRLTHWTSAIAIVAMAGSGLQIWSAYPYLGPRGEGAWWFPFQGKEAPAALRIGSWLAGARHVHFAFAWLLVGSGAAYITHQIVTGEWRRRAFSPRRDAGHALATALHYLRLRPEPPASGLYNGLQRAGYTVAVALAFVEVLSGLALWKPVQLASLAALFGGYEGARAIHLGGLVALAGFVVGHLGMVAAHPRTLVTMITGGKRE
jgi:thiosulfate reductase cytochrome b subunit